MKSTDRFILPLMLLIMLCSLGAWFQVYSQISTAADTLWLADAAGRFLNGERMSEAYYDPNMPLSVILYAPPALLDQLGIMPIYMGVFYYTLFFLAVTSFLLYSLLRAVPESDDMTAFLCVSAFVIVNTVVSVFSFTERDQILGMALCPFVLAQIFITKKWPLPRWLFHTTLLLGAVLILLKPHQGLLPTLIIAHRAFTQKRLDVWKDADFIYLAFCTIAYVALCLTYFSDYTFQVLPDVISLYPATISPHYIQYYSYYVLIFAVTLILGFLANGKKPSWPGTLFLICAVVTFISFAAQMRGYHYHLMPALMFFAMGFICTIRKLALKCVNKDRAALIALVIVVTLAFLHSPLKHEFPTHKQYKDMPISQILQHCPAPCPFFIMNDSIEIAHQTAAYTDHTWASRFPSVWFIPAIMLRLADGKTEEAAALRKKYGEMTAEDLARYKPKLIFLAEFKIFSKRVINLVKFFSVSPKFNEEWAKYHFVDRIVIDQGVYFKGSALGKNTPMVYRVYRRVEEPAP